MATVLESLRKSSINIQNINKTLSDTKKSTSSVNQSVENISRIVATNTRVKRELFERSNILSSRREEASRRQEIEDRLESSRVSTSPQSGLSFASRSEKGPLGRLLGFLGFTFAGWIVENLPTWIFMGQEFISRINSFGRSMYGMVSSMQNIIKSFGDTLGYSLDSILRLDFDEFAGEGTVARSFEELNLAVQDLGTNITDTFKLFTTPLTESLETGEQAPGLGEQREDTMFPGIQQETTGSSMRTVTGIHKQALDIIAGPESGGNYNAMNQGTIGNKIVGSTMGGKTSKDIIGKNLTNMTLGEIMQRQAYLMDKRNPQVSNYGIYAAGKYQIIPITFQSAMKGAGLTPNDIFSPENQDKMGLAVLKSQGIGAWTAGGSKYSAQETAIIKQAQRTPATFTPSTPQAPPPPSSSIKGGKIIEYLTGDRTHKRYRADHAAGNYHDHVAFDSKETRDAAIKWLRGKGWVVGSIDTGKHAMGSYHYSNQAFDIPFYPNQSKKGVTDDARGETILSSRLRSDLISGGFSGPQLGGSSAKPQDQQPSAQISAPSKPSQPAAMTPERKGSQMLFIDATQPQIPQASYPYQQQPSVTPTVSEFKLLNNFIKNKLLLDLAYL
jgi:hypothetical protein